MPLALAEVARRMTLRDKEIVLSVTPSGAYTAGGDTLDLTKITSPNFNPAAPIGYPGTISDYEVEYVPAGYGARLVPGATLATWKLIFTQGGAAVSNPSAEIPAAAYPGALTGTPTRIRLLGPKLRF